jgi:uncharacterized integral membrane protein (TIGR00698 family)
VERAATGDGAASGRATALLPGLLLTGAVAAVAWLGGWFEERWMGHAVIEALVLAILIGMGVRFLVTPSAAQVRGIDFAARQVLEVAVALLGLSVDLPLLLRAGPALGVGIVAVVVVGLSADYAIGRSCGLPPRLAVLVASGNAICGNSAIAAIAPVIGAEREHVASSIAFTAIIGVVVVVGLPLLRLPLGLDHYQYGILAGLTVYAVPQVLAAAFPVSVVSGQVGTLVKLVRVLMLGPVVLFFAIRNRQAVHRGTSPGQRHRLHLGRYVPWFVAAFLLAAGLRAAGVVPAAIIGPSRLLSGWHGAGDGRSRPRRRPARHPRRGPTGGPDGDVVPGGDGSPRRRPHPRAAGRRDALTTGGWRRPA